LSPDVVSGSSSDGEIALDVRELSVAYSRSGQERIAAVYRCSIVLRTGEVLGLAGESGSGKSTLALASIGYRGPGVVVEGQSILRGTDVLKLGTRSLRKVWGRETAYVAQGTVSTLNPAMTLSSQLREPLRAHMGLSGAALAQRERELLAQVALPTDDRFIRRYPGQLSGGQQQRVAIALALACSPRILILDEPTTGLDVTNQARMLALFKGLIAGAGTATLFVSHDLAVLSTVSDRLAIMYAGEIVESGPTNEVLQSPRHPYTRGLLGAVPDIRQDRRPSGIPGSPPAGAAEGSCAFASRCEVATDECRTRHPSTELIAGQHSVQCFHWQTVPPKVRLVTKVRDYEVRRTTLLSLDRVSCSYAGAVSPAVSEVSLSIEPGGILGVVGESGSGKSTLLRAIAGLHPPSSGTIRFRDHLLSPSLAGRQKEELRAIQLVFQHPVAALNPRHTVEQTIRSYLRLRDGNLSRGEERAEVANLLEAVKLPARVAGRYPPQVSGGQAQRVALARAFAAQPDLLLCDEVTSALDVSVQAAILELIGDLSEQFGTAVLFVSHDLAVVSSLAASTVVLKDGVVCESGRTQQLFLEPSHSYTRALLDALPRLSAHRHHSQDERCIDLQVNRSVERPLDPPGIGLPLSNNSHWSSPEEGRTEKQDEHHPDK